MVMDRRQVIPAVLDACCPEELLAELRGLPEEDPECSESEEEVPPAGPTLPHHVTVYPSV